MFLICERVVKLSGVLLSAFMTVIAVLTGVLKKASVVYIS